MARDKFQTLGEPVDYSHVPGVQRFSDPTKPASFDATIDIAGPVRFFVLQPEQVVVVRERLVTAGWDAADKITLPPRDAADYQQRRDLLVHTLQICCRAAIGRPKLVFAGHEGFVRLSKIDDGRLVVIARRLVEFWELFTPVPPAEVSEANGGATEHGAADATPG